MSQGQPWGAPQQQDQTHAQQQQQPQQLAPWQFQQQEYQRQQQEAYQRQQRQRGEAAPQWARQENQPDPVSRPSPCFIVPGLICCLVVIILSIVGLTNVQLRFLSNLDGTELGSVTQLKIDFDYTPSNASMPSVHIHLSSSAWTSDSTPAVAKLGQMYAAQAGIRITCLVLLILVVIYECLRFTSLPFFRREILAVRMLVAGTIVVVFVLAIFGSIIAAAVHRDAIKDFVDYVEGQLGFKVAAITGRGGLLISGIGLIFLIILLAFAIRTFVGRRCQECCCECCGCTLATEVIMPEQQQSDAAMRPMPGTTPQAHGPTVTGTVVSRGEV